MAGMVWSAKVTKTHSREYAKVQKDHFRAETHISPLIPSSADKDLFVEYKKPCRCLWPPGTYSNSVLLEVCFIIAVVTKGAALARITSAGIIFRVESA